MHYYVSNRIIRRPTIRRGHFRAEAWWRIGRVDAFRPKGHGFDSRSIAATYIGTLGKSFTQRCLWRFGVKFRHSIRAVSGAPLSTSRLVDLKRRYENSLNELMNA